MRTRENERVSVRQRYGYGCRYGTLNEANLLKTARTCCSLEAGSADFRPFVHDVNTSRPNRQVRSASGRDFSPLRHSPSCSGRPVEISKRCRDQRKVARPSESKSYAYKAVSMHMIIVSAEWP
jgi:hypothetical protein